MRKTIKKRIIRAFLLFLFGLFCVGVQAQHNEFSPEWVFKNFPQGTYVNIGDGTFVPLGETTDLSRTVVNSDGTWTNDYDATMLRGPYTNGVNDYGVTRIYVGNVPGLRGAPANGNTLATVIIVPMYKYILPTGEEITGFGGVTITEDSEPSDPGEIFGTPCILVCTGRFELGDDCKCVLKPELVRRPCEKATLSDHSYYTKDGVINKPGARALPQGTTLVPQSLLPKDRYGNPMVLTNTTTGFNSALYKVDNGDGKIEYVYATVGTDDVYDIVVDLKQATGNMTNQYRQSVENARALKIWADSNGYKLSFTGHSLGGGLANANALATGLPAVIYNPAGLQNHTITDLDLNINYSNKVTAYVVRGEPVDIANFAFGDPVRGTTKYIGSAVAPVLNYGAGLLLGTVTGGGGLVVGAIGAYNLHKMSTVILGLDCNQ